MVHREPTAAAAQADAVRVRDAAPADLAAIRAIYGEAIAGGIATMDSEPPSREALELTLANLGPRQALLVIEASGGVAGFGWLRSYSPRAGYQIACETSVYVSGASAGQGLGTRLQTALLTRARAAGYRHVTAKIVAANEGSIRFHRRHGFSMVGVQHGIGEIAGVLHDVAILELRLDEPPVTGAGDPA